MKREDIAEILERFFKTRIDERGRIYLPQPVRQRFSIKPDETVYIRIESDHLSIYTALALRKMQEQ